MFVSFVFAVATHFPTWAYDQYNGQGENASASVVQRYLTYAESGLSNKKPVTDCRGSGACQSVFYWNPNFIFVSPACPYAPATQFLAQAQESWFVHLPGRNDSAGRVRGSYTQTCKGQRITIPVYAINQSNPGVQAYFQSYLRTNADGFDIIFSDDTKNSISMQMHGPGGYFCGGACTQTAELGKDSDVVRGHLSLANALHKADGSPMSFFYNGLNFAPSEPLVPPLLGNGSPYKGVICENCIVNAGTLRTNMYAKVLAAMARIDSIPGASFVELNTGKDPTGSENQIAQRMVTTAVAWLGYADGHTVVWPNLEFNTRNLAVWPENMIVPAGPLQTMSGGSPAALQVTPNVYRREFAQCYNDGTAIGPCAAILNGTAQPVTVSGSWLQQKYGHTIITNGGDAPSGGTISLNSTAFNAGSTQIPPGSAILLVR